VKGPCATGIAYLLILGFTLFLTVAASHRTPLPADEAVLNWFQKQPWPGRPFSEAVRAITSTQVVLAAGAMTAVALGLMGRAREAWGLIIVLLLLPLLQTAIKELVDRPRPGPPIAELRASYSSPSFPAGHVMSPTALYLYLLGLTFSGLFPFPWNALTIAWAAVMIVASGPPNLWLGIHWPSDLLGGWLWGIVIAFPPLRWARK